MCGYTATSFIKGNNFCDCLFASLDDVALLNETKSKRKESVPFPLTLCTQKDQTDKKGQTEYGRVVSTLNVPNHLNKLHVL